MQNEGVITDEVKKELKHKALSVLNNKKASEWFSKDWQVKTESEILLPDGNFLRPDRVIMKNDTACVIDYKTGKEKEDDKKQVMRYAKILEEMKFKKVEKYLMYINDEYEDMIKIVELN